MNDKFVRMKDVLGIGDISRYTSAYTHELLLNEDKDYCRSLFYQYGPYLISNYMHIDACVKECKYDRDYPLRFIIDIVDMIRILNSKEKYKTVKAKLLKKVSECEANDEYNKNFTIIMKDILQDTISKIRTHQYDNYLLESAMMNYSPIVPYENILHKPALSRLSTNEYVPCFTKEEEKKLDEAFSVLESNNEIKVKERLDKFIMEYGIDIVNNNYSFINTKDYSNQYQLPTEGNLSSDLFDLFKSKNILNPHNQYYLLAYLAFNFNKEDYNSLYNVITKLKYTVNEIADTINTPLSSVLESLSVLSLPPKVNLHFMQHNLDKNN